MAPQKTESEDGVDLHYSKFDAPLLADLVDMAEEIKEEDDQTEIIIIKKQLSQDINTLEIDLQSVLGTLADKDDVPVDWLLQYREDAKRNIREFKNTLQLLEDQKSTRIQSKQTPPMGAGTAPRDRLGAGTALRDRLGAGTVPRGRREAGVHRRRPG